jgi:hypothetical protein
MVCVQPWRFMPILILDLPVKLRIPLRDLVVDELTRVSEAWVRGSTVGSEGLDEQLQQPARDCGDRARR